MLGDYPFEEIRELERWKAEAEKLLWNLGARSTVNGEIVAWRPDTALALLGTAEQPGLPSVRVEGRGSANAAEGDPGGLVACMRPLGMERDRDQQAGEGER